MKNDSSQASGSSDVPKIDTKDAKNVSNARKLNNERTNSHGSNGNSHDKSKVWLFLDILAFFIILIALSTALILVSTPTDPNRYYSNYHSTDEYVELAMETMLSSTVPMIEYQIEDPISNSNKADVFTMEFSDETIEWLIGFEIFYITEIVDKANGSAGQSSLENQIRQALDNAFDDKIKYVLVAGFADNLEKGTPDPAGVIIISNTNFQGTPNDLNGAVYKKNMENNYTVSNLDDQNQILIRLYIL
jgi:hypothetical protein